MNGVTQSLSTVLPPVIQIVGYKNSGKTTLITELLRLWAADGKRVAVIKHDAHQFQMDHPGTDTFAHTEAGAAAVAITSPTRTAIIREQPSTLQQIIAELAAQSADSYDLILVEGFKQEPYPKAALIAREADLPLLDHLTELHWIYTRLQPNELNALLFEQDHSREPAVQTLPETLNLKETPIIPAGKDGIMKLFIALNAYIMSYAKR
ncbi:molybdopterin-guanine dinucleotide biosynthesis protein B [Paenibacillus bovis]|uniref:Molybdopterin-guanine dinucleotide biosynthesis protein B n=1 Tax=Paenibacillus bovis TaxID=1616788 RepID=A0A172ZIE9_9BACL|nr:molybdopterin-guanine dinucleotide biosynthesis protein B [Paenibacillus bovis]ANF97172.1 molybdopterin-guanine dinucleotide biosynthesis protein B [Paenibacillus bovis]